MVEWGETKFLIYNYYTFFSHASILRYTTFNLKIVQTILYTLEYIYLLQVHFVFIYLLRKVKKITQLEKQYKTIYFIYGIKSIFLFSFVFEKLSIIRSTLMSAKLIHSSDLAGPFQIQAICFYNLRKTNEKCKYTYIFYGNSITSYIAL